MILPIASRRVKSGIQANLGVDNGVQVDVCAQNVPQFSSVVQLAGLFEVSVVSDATFYPSCQEGECATAVSKQDFQLGESVKDAAEKPARYRSQRVCSILVPESNHIIALTSSSQQS
jgi:hypothetical protein